MPIPQHWNVVPDLIMLMTGLVLQSVMLGWAWKRPGWTGVGRRAMLAAAYVVSAGVMTLGYVLSFQRSWRILPTVFATWVQALAMIFIALLGGLFVWMVANRTAARLDRPRRRFLQAAGSTLAAAPFVGTAFGIVTRDQFELLHVKVPVKNLHRDLEGLRFVQITDIHLSPFLTRRQFARAVDMANETKAHLALVTGDLITRLGDPLDDCLAELARLRGEAGVLGCLGNHEVYTKSQDYVTREGARIGIDFLRQRARRMRFGGASINFAGVDYQPRDWEYLRGAEGMVVPGELNVLLSHNPDVFPVAAKKGYDLTISGHTHGGQVNFELLHRNMNVALAFTPYTRGLYSEGGASIYVSSGIGTIGVPVRVGAPAEVSLIELVTA